MKKFMTLLSILFLISGCTLKLDLDVLEKDIIYQNALQYTKRAEMIKELDTKATISVTYLNAVDFETYNNDEYFLIGIYMPLAKYTLLDWGYSLNLNNKGFKSIEKINEDSVIYKKFPFLNKWSKHYIVKFDKVDKNQLDINYIHKTYGKVKLSFKKDL
jgi:hypothetical protein